MAGDEPRAIPEAFLSWVEKPLADALAAVERVPLRLDEHRQWLAVFRAIGNAQSACRDLHRLAAFTDPGKPTKRGHATQKKTLRPHAPAR